MPPVAPIQPMASRPLPATPAPQPIYEEIDMDEAAPLEPPRDLGAVARRAAEHVVDRLEIFEHSHVLRSLKPGVNYETQSLLHMNLPSE